MNFLIFQCSLLVSLAQINRPPPTLTVLRHMGTQYILTIHLTQHYRHNLPYLSQLALLVTFCFNKIKHHTQINKTFPLSSYTCSSMGHLILTMQCSSISTLSSLLSFQWSVFSRLLLSAPW